MRDGDVWWQYDPRSGAVTNEGDPRATSGTGQELEQLLDPAYLLACFTLEIEGETETAGREALEVRARPRPTRNPFVHLFGMEGAELRLVVDRERGVLLRRASLFEGAEATSTEIVEVAWDESFAPGTFRLELPDGEVMRSVRDDFPVTTSLDEALRRASFPVFVPRLPEGSWRMHVLYTEETARPPGAESIGITYTRDDARRQFSLQQGPIGGVISAHAGELANAEPRAGRPGYLVVRPQGHGWQPFGQLLWDRGGTSLRLTSEDFELEELLRLAGSLAPA